MQSGGHMAESLHGTAQPPHPARTAKDRAVTHPTGEKAARVRQARADCLWAVSHRNGKLAGILLDIGWRNVLLPVLPGGRFLIQPRLCRQSTAPTSRLCRQRSKARTIPTLNFAYDAKFRMGHPRRLPVLWFQNLCIAAPSSLPWPGSWAKTTRRMLLRSSFGFSLTGTSCAKDFPFGSFPILLNC